jgi:hypothetical protein
LTFSSSLRKEIDTIGSLKGILTIMW